MSTTALPHQQDIGSHVQGADYRAGILGGLVAGVAMVPVMMAITTFLMKMGPWPAAKMAWSLVAGKEVIAPGFEFTPVVGGMVVHLLLSAAFGLVFAWLASLLRMSPVTLGALYGFGLYLTNIIAVPKLFPAWAGHMYPMNGMMHAAMVGEHLFFGLVLGVAYAAFRRA